MPKLIRVDRGTENSLLSGIQPFLRENHTDSLAGMKSFMYGRSTANQRIEAFWGHVRKFCIQYYINLFKDMMDENIFDNSNPMHIDCMRYCFMDIIQKDLNKLIDEWNSHRIRKQRRQVQHGKPELMYEIPNIFNARQCGLNIDIIKINQIKNIYCENIDIYNNKPFEELISDIMPEINKPENPQQAKELFITIIEIINHYSE